MPNEKKRRKLNNENEISKTSNEVNNFENEANNFENEETNNFENSEEIALVDPPPLSPAPQELRRSDRLAAKAPKPWEPGTLPDVLYLVFRYLNGESLHRARQVCREWDRVIRVEVWGSTEGRRAVEARLHNNWLSAQPRIRTMVHTWKSLHLPFFHFQYFHIAAAAEDFVILMDKTPRNLLKAYVFVHMEEGKWEKWEISVQDDVDDPDDHYVDFGTIW